MGECELAGVDELGRPLSALQRPVVGAGLEQHHVAPGFGQPARYRGARRPAPHDDKFGLDPSP